MSNNRNHYEIDYDDMLGHGAYGKIYKAWHIIKKEWYAVKIEPVSNKKVLEHESQIIKIINEKHSNNVLKFYDYFSDDNFNYCILPLLGVSLKHILSKLKIMDMVDIFFIAPKLIEQVQLVHSAGIIHRDIKPANFMYTCDLEQIILIDFGLAIKQEDANNDSKFKGTINYMSINALKRGHPRVHDDLQSLGYMLLQMRYGSLYWSGIKYKTKDERNKKMIQLKTNLTNEDLVRQFTCDLQHNCAYKKAMHTYFCYINNKDNYDINYEYLKSLFEFVNHT